MKVKRKTVLPVFFHFLFSIGNVLFLFLVSSNAYAAPSANIVYSETDLGGGLWQYDYSFNNENLYSVFIHDIYRNKKV